MTEELPEHEYQRRRASFVAEREEAARRSARISRARFGVFLLLLVPLFGYESAGATGRLLLIGGAVGLAAVFATLVILHARSRERERWFEMRVRLCDEGIRRIARDWTNLPDLGDPPRGSHPYALDLDLFGTVSLSALLGAIGTAPGRSLLRTWILSPVPLEDARARQTAVTELAARLDLRETLAARGRLVGTPAPASLATFLEWATDTDRLPARLGLASFLLPAAIAGAAVAYGLGAIGLALLSVPLVASLAVHLRYVRRIHQSFDRVSSGEVGLGHYAGLAEPVADATFEDPLLRRAQARLSADGVSASRQLARLLRLVRLSDSRRNTMVHWILQVGLQWDVHVARALERWRERAGSHAAEWAGALAELDALGALAALRFENPTWCYPDLQEAGDTIDMIALAHPYLDTSTVVANDVAIGPSGRFLLVTGSNMSGKSTLLRAVGVNVVLARAGGPVAAQRMTLPPVRLYTSMRVRDSLEEGVSFFMAELRRLKAVVDAAGQPGPPLLYLLDEILQGTNTAERQIAARTVVRSLLDAGAIGAITTHDLTLAATPDLASRAEQVHFQETFGRDADGPTLSFDYKLHEGLATTTNALALMELVGLPAPGGAREREG